MPDNLHAFGEVDGSEVLAVPKGGIFNLLQRREELYRPEIVAFLEGDFVHLF